MKDNKDRPRVRGIAFLYCRHCGKKLTETNRRELEAGFCAKCRKDAKGLPGQLTLDIAVQK
jgi:hypothetical protein